MQTKFQSEVTEENASPLPKSKMPTCWVDDMRMDYLFSEIRSESVNPLDLETKMKFWTSLIETWCVSHNHPTFTISALKKSFQRNSKSPMCLSTVIETLHRNGELITYEEFVGVPPQQTWTTWTVDIFLKKPAVWTFNKVKDSVVKKNTDIDKTYVHVAACKELGEKLMSLIESNHIHQIFEINELATLCHQKNIDQLLVIIHGLRRQKKAAVKEDGIILIKLGDTNITNLDVGVYTLRRNEQTLTKHLEQLEAEKQNAVQEARIYITKNMRQAAKSCLRKKHVLDKCIDKRLAALDNVRLLLSQIQEAHSDAQVVEAYKLGASALKATLKTAGLTEDSAADTMLQVEEVLDMHKEIQAALAQPIEAEDDLEGELAQLLAPEKDTLEDRLTGLTLADLPEPPESLLESSLPKTPAATRTKQPTMQPAV